MVFHQSWQINKAASPLQIARYKARKTIRGIAKIVGVSPNSIFSYEHGKANPQQKVWEKLQACLGLEGHYEDYFSTHINLRYHGELCSTPGCTRPARAKSYCMRHYIQKYRQRKRGKGK